MFTWLSDLMTWLAAFCPRLIVMKLTDGGVKYVRGKHAKYIGPGLHLFWPITTSVESYPTVRQTIELASQVLTTSDGCSVSVGIVVVYTVEDIFTLLTTVYQPEEVISDIAKGSVIEVMHGKSYNDIIKMDIGNEISKLARKNLRRYGVAVDRALITDFTRVISLNLTNLTSLATRS